MANNLTGNPWQIDTAGAGTLTTDLIRVNKFRWTGGTTAGHTCVVKNAAGRIVWRSVAAGVNFIDDSSHEFGSIVGNVMGLIVDALGSGVLEIYLV